MKFSVLLTDDITLRALEVFEAYDDIDAQRTGTLMPEELKGIIGKYHGAVIRTPTRLTADVLERATRLRFIGRAGVGTDNIDVDAATALGITVMNSPHGNTISTAEHTLALILSAARLVPHAHASVTRGEWNRKAYRGVELYGKTLGIIGLGAVGKEVAKRAIALGMKVVAADPNVDRGEAAAVGAETVDLPGLCARSDVVTVHVPLEPGTKKLIGKGELDSMRNGVLLVNCARGGVVDETALLDALASGKVSGVGMDVYENEPPGESPLLGHPRSVFTPHVGAATLEAQVRVATDAAEAVAEALTRGIVRNAVNNPGRPR